MTLNSKHSRQTTQEDETVVLQKSRYKILTYTSLFEQNNDHTQISHDTEFCSSFKFHGDNEMNMTLNDLL